MPPPTRFRWLKVRSMFEARAGAACTLLSDGRVLVEGGHAWDSTRHGSRVAGPEVYSPLEDRWRQGGASGVTTVTPSPRPKHTGVASKGLVKRERATLTRLPNGDVLVTGGFETSCRFDGEEDDHSVRAVEVVSTFDEVLDGGQLPTATHDHGVVVLPSGAVLIIGGYEGETQGTRAVQLGVPAGLELAQLGPALEALATKVFREEDCKVALQEVRDLVSAGRPGEALTIAEREAARSHDSEDAYRAVAMCLVALQRVADAVEPLRRATALAPDSAFSLVELADALFFSGQKLQARPLYERVLVLCTEDSTWTWQPERRARQQLQFLDLEEGKVAKVAKGPGDRGSSQEWNNAGAAAHSAGKHEDARHAFARAVEVNPKNDFAWGNLASVLISLKRPKEALAAAEKTLELCNDPRRTAEANVSKGIALHDLGRYQESVAAYDTALALHSLPYAWNNRANSLRRLKRVDEAMASFEKAAALGYPLAHWGRACIFVDRGDLVAAQAAVDLVLRADPSQEKAMRGDEELAALWKAQPPPRKKKSGKHRKR